MFTDVQAYLPKRKTGRPYKNLCALKQWQKQQLQAKSALTAHMLFTVKKRGCVGITTKIHLTTDKFGRPIRINLTAGNINDRLLFKKQIEDGTLKDITVLADRA